MINRPNLFTQSRSARVTPEGRSVAAQHQFDQKVHEVRRASVKDTNAEIDHVQFVVCNRPVIDPRSVILRVLSLKEIDPSGHRDHHHEGKLR